MFSNLKMEVIRILEKGCEMRVSLEGGDRSQKGRSREQKENLTGRRIVTWGREVFIKSQQETEG